jgi:hypothetical protein
MSDIDQLYTHLFVADKLYSQMPSTDQLYIHLPSTDQLFTNRVTAVAQWAGRQVYTAMLRVPFPPSYRHTQILHKKKCSSEQ